MLPWVDALQVSDFAIGQFRFLARLLLVHGRWSFKRNKEVVLYAFYKNFVYASCNIYLAFVSGFSSQPLYSTAMIATYNVLWTSLPTIAMGVYEEDMPAHQALKDPSVYQDTQQEHRRQFFVSFSLWLVGALMHSLLLFCGVFFGLNSTSALSPMGGRQDGFWAGQSIHHTEHH
jgi:magnesium-transporting ATPase (P-type)